MTDPLIILAPPRSFTTVVSAVLGQHPQMYGLPEVNLFAAETMRERAGVIAQPPWSDHGLLRAVAQIYGGEQTFQTVSLAKKWVKIRGNSTCVAVFRLLAEKVAPRIPVDKSPRTVVRAEYMQRIKRNFPNARYIHLLRHPRGHGESFKKLGSMVREIHPVAASQTMAGGFGPMALAAAKRTGAYDHGSDPPVIDFQKTWFAFHMNIITFLAGVPPSQQCQIRGEDFLADPDGHLPKIAEWLGLRTDADALDAMKHPERSPYSCLGPMNAQYGNDPGFLMSPALRPSSGAKQKLSLEGPLSWRPDGRGFTPEVKELAREFGYE